MSLRRLVRAIEEFMDEHLSNWYVRLCRRRFWKGEYEHDKSVRLPNPVRVPGNCGKTDGTPFAVLQRCACSRT